MNLSLWLCLTVCGFFSMEAIAQKTSCPSLSLKNGRVRIRGGGRMAYFRCKKRFKRVGHKLAVCLSSGTWSQQTPVCVGRGCPDLGTLPDVTVTELYKGGILQFTCPQGMRREGPQKLMCDGTNWDQEPPRCLYGVSPGCDFEDSSLCGWIQDANDDFDWTWNSGLTPTTETGPQGDHTTGTGHYIFMESSAPQKSGHVTRLISPPYQPTADDMCMDFFYHMKGPDKQHEVGDLDVYVRTGTDDQPIDVSVFHRNSYQGDDWIKGHVTIPDQQDVYRIVFAATRRESWTGDIALDDIRVFNCSDMPETTTVEMTSAPSDITTITPTTIIITTKKPTSATTVKITTLPPPTTATTTLTTTARSSSTTTTVPSTTTTTTTMSTKQSTSPSTATSTLPTTTTTTTLSTRPTSTPTPTTTRYTTTAEMEPTRGNEFDMTSSTMTRPTYYPVTYTSSVEMSTPEPDVTSSPPSKGEESASSSPPPDRSSSSSPPSSSSSTRDAMPTTEGSGWGTSDADRTPDLAGSTDSTDSTDRTDTQTRPDPGHTSSAGPEPGVGNQRSAGGGSSVSDYLPLIVGVSLGLAVGMAVVGVLAWLWARNRRKQKELQVEEDQLNIIGSIDGNSYSYPPSGSQH